MEISFEQYERIQDYLDGIMPPEMHKDFENELNADPALAEHLTFERDLRKDLESIEKDGPVDYGFSKPDVHNKFDDPSYLLGLIRTAGQDFKKTASNHTSRQTDTISISYRTGWAIAASVILITACAIAFFKPSSNPGEIVKNDTSGRKQNKPDNIPIPLPPSEPNFAALFKQFFTKDETPEEKPVFLADALNDYDRGKYSSIQKQNLAGIPAYRDNINSRENVLEQGHFYKGMAFTQTGNGKEAIRNLQWVIDHAHNRQLMAKARWYLALVYLKEKDKDSAVFLLNSITENTQSALHKDDAKKLMDLLR